MDSVPDTRIAQKAFVNAYHQYNKALISSVTTAVILLASLAWNDVVQAIVDKYYPEKDKKTIKGKLYYAIVMTFFIILLQIYVFPYIGADK